MTLNVSHVIGSRVIYLKGNNPDVSMYNCSSIYLNVVCCIAMQGSKLLIPYEKLYMQGADVI